MPTTMQSFTSSQQKNNTWFPLIVPSWLLHFDNKENATMLHGGTLVGKAIHLS